VSLTRPAFVAHPSLPLELSVLLSEDIPGKDGRFPSLKDINESDGLSWQSTMVSWSSLDVF